MDDEDDVEDEMNKAAGGEREMVYLPMERSVHIFIDIWNSFNFKAIIFVLVLLPLAEFLLNEGCPRYWIN